MLMAVGVPMLLARALVMSMLAVHYMRWHKVMQYPGNDLDTNHAAQEAADESPCCLFG
jgi:hypothetical protein